MNKHADKIAALHEAAVAIRYAAHLLLIDGDAEAEKHGLELVGVAIVVEAWRDELKDG